MLLAFSLVHVDTEDQDAALRVHVLWAHDKILGATTSPSGAFRRKTEIRVAQKGVVMAPTDT